MDETMLTSFMDELEKIAANTIAAPAAPAKPAPLTFGSKPSSALRTEAKPTNYSVVNTQTRNTGFGAANASKSQPAPNIRV